MLGDPQPCGEGELTGQRRYRALANGMLVLEVQTRSKPHPAFYRFEWRDATVQDLTQHDAVR